MAILTVKDRAQLVEITVYSGEFRWDLVERVHDILDDEQVLGVTRWRRGRRRGMDDRIFGRHHELGCAQEDAQLRVVMIREINCIKALNLALNGKNARARNWCNWLAPV